jgi:hypothetical protein
MRSFVDLAEATLAQFMRQVEDIIFYFFEELKWLSLLGLHAVAGKKALLIIAQ